VSLPEALFPQGTVRPMSLCGASPRHCGDRPEDSLRCMVPIKGAAGRPPWRLWIAGEEGPIPTTQELFLKAVPARLCRERNALSCNLRTHRQKSLALPRIKKECSPEALRGLPGTPFSLFVR